MTFKNNFIAVIKHDGKILREKDGAVLLPFGAEYSLMFKNQESRRARVLISIDGEDVLNGYSLVVNGNSQANLDGFLDQNGNVHNRFKFIQKTEKIVKHRGDNIDDGSIRIEYKFEKPKPENIDINYRYHDYHIPPTPPKRRRTDWPYPYPYRYITTWANSEGFSGESQGCLNAIGTAGSNEFIMNYMNADLNETLDIADDEGITVKGSISNQKLASARLGALESNSHVIILNLRGTNSMGAQIAQPVTVKTKLVCETCGTKNKSTHNCCCACGTSLI